MIDGPLLKAVLARCARAMHDSADELNALDARLGDGDLGATLDKCAANIEAGLPAMPDSLADVLRQSAQACANASGSSFGTLLSVGFLAAAKWVGARESIDRAGLSALLHHTVQALSERGGATLGDKTMLDSLHAIALALDEPAGAEDAADTARRAASQAIEDFDGKPNRIGRARMFAEKSMGLQDPGMVAVLRMAGAL